MRTYINICFQYPLILIFSFKFALTHGTIGGLGNVVSPSERSNIESFKVMDLLQHANSLGKDIKTI